MKILIARINETEVNRKAVKKADPLTMHQFMFETGKKFKGDIKIEVKDGRKELNNIIVKHFVI